MNRYFLFFFFVLLINQRIMATFFARIIIRKKYFKHKTNTYLKSIIKILDLHCFDILFVSFELFPTLLYCFFAEFELFENLKF